MGAELSLGAEASLHGAYGLDAEFPGLSISQLCTVASRAEQTSRGVEGHSEPAWAGNTLFASLQRPSRSSGVNTSPGGNTALSLPRDWLRLHQERNAAGRWAQEPYSLSPSAHFQVKSAFSKECDDVTRGFQYGELCRPGENIPLLPP